MTLEPVLRVDVRSAVTFLLPLSGSRRPQRRERLEPAAVNITDTMGRHHSVEQLVPDVSSFRSAGPAGHHSVEQPAPDGSSFGL